MHMHLEYSCGFLEIFSACNMEEKKGWEEICQGLGFFQLKMYTFLLIKDVTIK